jgi:hypothetical protein
MSMAHIRATRQRDQGSSNHGDDARLSVRRGLGDGHVGSVSEERYSHGESIEDKTTVGRAEDVGRYRQLCADGTRDEMHGLESPTRAETTLQGDKSET